MNASQSPDEKYILLVGAANSGKTTLFNHLTGAKQKVVNYPGSTVDFAQGKLLGSDSITVVDIPGISSLISKSEDEKVAIKALHNLSGLIPGAKSYLIISVVDSTQRSRQLALTKQLLNHQLPVLVAMTMTDIAFKQESHIDIDALSQKVSLPIVAINGRTGGNVTGLKHHCLDQLSKLKSPFCFDASKSEKQDFMKRSRDWAESVVQGLGEDAQKKSVSKWSLDALCLHPIWGSVLFLGIWSVFFYSIFSLAAPLMDVIDTSFVALGDFVLNLALPDLIKKFLVEGILGGLGAIFVFVPQLAILFFGINLLESSGYLARAAILVDKPLSKIGLSGRAFVPLLSGFACAIPAMMAVRNIPGHRQRLLCLFIIPLMQCSARLPVYGLLFAMVFPDSPFKSAMGLLVIYIMSVLIASIVAKLAGKYFKLFKSESLFHLELPTWKWPIAKNTIYSVYSQTKSFVVGAGPIIFIISIVLWFLANFPSVDSSFAMMIGQVIEPLFKPMGLDWRVGVAILLSFAAREVFVSVLAVVFAVDSQVSGIVETLSQATFQGSELPIFTTSSIVGLILFFMIALQCGATVAIAKKEMRNWKLPMIQLGVYIALAYVLSVVSVQGLRLMGIE